MRPPDCWAIVAAGDEVADGLLARTAWGTNLLLYRTAAGEVVALTDRCCHRQLPLSMGRRVGDDVVCGYHGFRFASDGACVEVPGQQQIPSRARVETFPVVEHGGWVWAWLGTDVPVVGFEPPVALDDQAWRSVGGAVTIAAPAGLLVENLHDLSHIPYLHPTTIGSAAFVDHPYESSGDGRVLRTRRVWADVDCPPMYQASAGLASPVDRIIETAFVLPSLVVIDSQIRPAGAPVEQARRIVHEIAVVPEHDGSHHYLWRSSWNFALDDEAVAAVVGGAEVEVIAEDKVVLEAQWSSIRQAPEPLLEISVKSDAGSLYARRAFEHVLASGRLPVLSGPSPSLRLVDSGAV